MRIINGKYRIDKLISNSRSYSMYEAVDLTKNRRKINIYILNIIHVEKSLLEIYVNEFERNSVSRDVCVNVLDFGSTINLSSKEKKLEYFYVTESISEYKSLLDVSDEVDESVLIDIFVHICKLAQEQCFSYIKTIPFGMESIYVSKDFKVKLKDKITALLDCRELGMSIYYAVSEKYKDTIVSKVSYEDYYLDRLREIFVSMVLRNKGVKLYGKVQHDVDETIISEENHQYHELLGEKISKLIYNLYNNNLEKEENKILSIIAEVNKVFNKSYKYISSKKENLNFDIPLIGRHEEVANIIKSIDECIKEKNEQGVILIHGEIGIGKTRLATNIKHLIETNYKNYLKCIYVTDYESNIAISNLLKQVVMDTDKALLNKYKKELSIIMPEIYGEESVSDYENIGLKVKNNVALMTKIALFLLEHYSDKHDVIILDNVHMYDNFSLGIIQYILSRGRNFSNIPVIISYRDGDCLGNSYFTDMLSKISTRVNLEVHLTPLSEEMTSVVLKNILNTHGVSEGFRDLIYKHSMGNPLLIEEGIKYLRDRKVIYIDETDGIWKKISNHEIYMSTDMEDICRHQIAGLSEGYIDILYKMSYFYMSVNLSVIIEFLNMDEQKLLDRLNYLISKGFLYKTQNNKSVRYAFYNKFLKNYLYRSVDERKSEDKHRYIAKILMRYYRDNEEEYIDEIIYHLEKIKDKRILEFYQKREKDLEKLNKIEDAIKFNFKILNFIGENRETEGLRKEEIAVNMRLGELYNRISEKRISIEYYLTAKNLCNEEKYLNEYIDILREILFLSIDLGLEKNVNKYLKEMRAAVNKSDYRIGKIKYLIMIIWKKYNNQEYERVIELCNYGISLCKEEDEEDRLTLMNYYVDTLVVQGKEIEGLELLKSMAKRCEELNFNKRLCRITNSMGVLYSDYIQCGEEGLKWFQKSNDLGIVGDDEAYKVNSLSNLGFTNYVMLNYDKAYEYFNMSSNKAIENEVLSTNFYNFSYIGMLLYKMGKYGECYKYAKLCSHYIDKDYSKYWQEAGPYCIFMYFISDITGNREECKRYLDEGIEILKESKSVMGYEIKLLYNIYSLCYEKGNTSVLEVINSAEKILYMDFRISMLCYGVNKLISLGLIDEAVEIYTYMVKNGNNIKADLNKAEIAYLGVVLNQNVSYKELVDILELLEDKNIMLKVKISFEIAKGYYREGNYTYSASYISECCGEIIDVLESMPSHFIKDFISENKEIIKVFELMTIIRKHYGLIKYNPSIEGNVYKVENIVAYLKGIVKQSIVNDAFLEDLKKQNKNYFQEENTIDDVIGKLNGDINENLNAICRHINVLTISSKTTILFEHEGELSIAASTDESREIPEELSIINISRKKKTPLILKDRKIIEPNGEVITYDVDSNNKTVMCIPITQVTKSGRVNGYGYTNDLLGYIYVETNKKINNITINTMKKCINISRLLYVIIDRDNIRKSSSIDNLTGALMRKHLEIFIQDQIEKSYTYGKEFSIIMFDIDKFKEINDSYGHRMGDKVLRKLCKTIFSNIRKNDVIGRYGGEEFIIVLPDIGVNEAEIIAERIRNKIQMAKLMGAKRAVTVSMGIANYPAHATTYDELIEKSDQALYEAKNGGRNRTKIWNESYGYKISTTNRLSGIFVGNGDQDYKNISTVIEFIDLINSRVSIREKIITTINRISEITEAEACIFYTIKDGQITNEYCKSIEQYEIVDTEYSSIVVNSAIETKENICGIDWNCIEKSSESMVIPDIRSNMVILLKNKKDVVGAIHLYASINHKEFNYDQLNYINTLAKIMVPMLEEI